MRVRRFWSVLASRWWVVKYEEFDGTVITHCEGSFPSEASALKWAGDNFIAMAK